MSDDADTCITIYLMASQSKLEISSNSYGAILPKEMLP